MSSVDPASDATRLDRVTLAVLGLTALALLARLVSLGDRPFHWDEARVGYWTLRFLETGSFEYRPVAGGPFLYVVGHTVFELVGVTDASARAAVAVVGGLSPLAALLFRGRLDDLEVVSLGAVLAASPLLLYYSRFLRGEVPLAVFSLVAAGSFLRAYDGEGRFLYLGALAGGLALTTSGFVVGYVSCWLVAAVLVFDHQRLLGAGADARASAVTRLRGVGDYLTPGARVFLLVVAVVVVFYAPRGAGLGLLHPSSWPVVLDEALYGSVRKFYGVRIASRASEDGHPFLPFLIEFSRTLVVTGLPILLLGVGAFLADRYSSGRPRPVVAGFAYWGFAAMLVVPVVAEVNAPWLGVHVLVPLAVPAAVGLAGIVRYGGAAFERDRASGVLAAALVVAAIGGYAGALAASEVYGGSTPESQFAHYGQPADDLDPFLASVSAAIDGNDGTDVLFYGDRYLVSDEAALGSPPVPDAWGERLPLAWYLERLGAETDSTTSLTSYQVQSELPPVVVADVADRPALAQQLEGYEASQYDLALWDREVVVFVRA